MLILTESKLYVSYGDILSIRILQWSTTTTTKPFIPKQVRVG
jgi:hypothetical protein